ncbi:MAG: hypothetical protein FJY20_03350 [Bacteroidetes bacterium]|nr:hypothetical protein [Bacteroidota bacterium]
MQTERFNMPEVKPDEEVDSPPPSQTDLEEAIRVIKKSKKWEPAFLNGYHIKAYKKQVIVFDLQGEE